jgi:hypothetical protein
MFKEAFICGIGLALDLSGNHYIQTQPPRRLVNDQMGVYWRQVGGFISLGSASELPRVEEVKQRQLTLNLELANA